jgi:hypothetical protein
MGTLRKGYELGPQSFQKEMMSMQAERCQESASEEMGRHFLGRK